jgi:hypothetical protein
MKKIPTIFKRNPENMARVLPEINSECEWVAKGEGVATRKYDGTCCMIKGRRLFKRREIRRGKKQPADFILEEYDPNTGKSFGWVPVSCDRPEDKYHCEAWFNQPGLPDGTYELVGPKIQGNPEKYPQHTLISHANVEIYPDCPRTFEGLCAWLSDKDIEGIVFHHPDGRMAKIKKRDFGLNR